MITEKTELNTETWTTKYYDLFYRYTFSRVNDHNQASDIVQDTFLAGLMALERFEGKSTVKTWLFSILKRKIIDYWRMQSTRKTAPFSYYERNSDPEENLFEEILPSNLFNAEQTMENSELRKLLFNAIYALPEKWVPVVLDRFIHEKSCEDICQGHDLSINNVWVILYRAKRQLREGLTRNWINA